MLNLSFLGGVSRNALHYLVASGFAQKLERTRTVSKTVLQNSETRWCFKKRVAQLYCVVWTGLYSCRYRSRKEHTSKDLFYNMLFFTSRFIWQLLIVKMHARLCGRDLLSLNVGIFLVEVPVNEES